ncbi:MAG: hypothetical protein Fur0025_32030 [Oscillatoriaceae cyanobacterium]
MTINNLETAVLENFRLLPIEQQREVFQFTELLKQKFIQNPPEPIPNHPARKLSMQEIAKLPIAQRHQILASSIAATAADFLNDPELTEFSVLDGEAWELDDE